MIVDFLLDCVLKNTHPFALGVRLFGFHIARRADLRAHTV